MYAFVVRKLERFKQKADRAGFLEEEDVKRVKDMVNEAKEDVKKHKYAIMTELDNLKRLIHGELIGNRNPSENLVQSNVNKMFEQEWEEEEKLTEDLEKRLDALKNRQKRKEPPVPDLDQSRMSKEKDLDSQLSPGILAYDITPAQLESWVSSFWAYVANGKGLDNKAVVAYICKFLDK